MNILTGNDLKTGDVVWWTGKGWSRDVNDAVDTGDQTDEIAAREEAERHVNVPYAVEADIVDGKVRPAHIKERIRTLGPTVRPDLTLRPNDPDAIREVI